MRRCLPLALLLLSWQAAAHTAAQAGTGSVWSEDDPYAHRVRTAVFPVFFQIGVSQTHLGSAARAEIDIVRGLGLQLDGRLPWANVAGETGPRALALHAALLWHFEDRAEVERLSGTVYPEDTPSTGGRGVHTDHDLPVPISQKLGGPRMTLPEKDRTLTAPMRAVQTLRMGYTYRRTVERAFPAAVDGTERHALNRFHALFAGYGWGTHWNLTPESAGGVRELGWRRFYVDMIVTFDPWVEARALDGRPAEPNDLFNVGARMAMEGAIDALLPAFEQLGFAYLLELGVLPGESGFEGYLMLAFGAELDG